MPRLKSWGLDAPVVVNFIIPENAGAVDSAIFVADDFYEIVEARECHITAGTDGSAVTLDILKAASGTAFGSGTTMLSSTFNLKSTAATPVAKSDILGGLTATRADRRVQRGDTIYVNFAGTLTAYVGGCLTVVLKRYLKTVNR